jgi:FkbM family methyltransferase
MGPTALGRAFHWYARRADHPFKIRILRALKRTLGLDVVVTATQFGVMRLDLDDLVQWEIFVHGSYEPLTLRRVCSLLAEGDCFVDVGANVGEFSLAAARIVGLAGRVLAIEPNPEIAAELLVNRRLNGWEDRMRVVIAAASDTTKFARFGIPEPRNRGTSREIPTDSTLEAIVVQAAPLRDILRFCSIGLPKVIKIDVEGAELEVLRGLVGDAEDRFAPNIIFEHIPSIMRNASADDLIGQLRNWGYEILTVTGEPFAPGEAPPEHNLWARRR